MIRIYLQSVLSKNMIRIYLQLVNFIALVQFRKTIYLHFDVKFKKNEKNWHIGYLS